MARMRTWLTVALAALAASGCNGNSGPPAQPAGFVSEATWPDEPYPSAGLWPFTVTGGVLNCHAPHRVTFTANGVEYALNGAAKSTGQFQDVNPILRDTGGYVEIDETRAPAKQGVGPMVVGGLDLCSG